MEIADAQARARTLEALKKLQQAVVATSAEILALIENKRCYDTGHGATDLALPAAVLLTPDIRLWTMDRDLTASAARSQSPRSGIAMSADSSPRMTEPKGKALLMRWISMIELHFAQSLTEKDFRMIVQVQESGIKFT